MKGCGITDKTKIARVLLFGVTTALSVIGNTREKVIFDTDMVSDYDDIGALACLHALADAGECDILATVSCTRNNKSVAAIEIVNHFYGRAEIPVGCTHGIGVEYVPIFEKRDVHEKYEWLATRYAGWVKHMNSSDAPDATEIYRRILMFQPDKSVTICSVGFLSNLRLLLESKPDAVSPLDGRALVAKKVKVWCAMACSYPKGKEYNVMVDADSARIALAEWPTPIIFSDAQYGKTIFTGRAVSEKAFPFSNPVKDLYAHALPPYGVTNSCNNDLGRSSWDQTTVLAAVRGTGKYFCLDHGRYRITGCAGLNEWNADAATSGGRLVETMPKTEVGRVIDEIMCREPVCSKKEK